MSFFTLFLFLCQFQNLTDFNIDREWRVMSLNRDWNGFEFISSIEHFRYPFYGIQVIISFSTVFQTF